MIAVGDGRVLLASRNEPFELRAFMPGTVIEIQPSLSVLIETHGALIQSKWGSGRKTFGVLRVAATDPTQPLLAQSIDVGYQDAIIAVGGMVGREALQAVIAARARGIVAGSIPGELADYARRVHLPVLVTEGFGNRIMPKHTWNLLVENNGRDAVLDANPTDRFAGSRPELIIPVGLHLFTALLKGAYQFRWIIYAKGWPHTINDNSFRGLGPCLQQHSRQGFTLNDNLRCIQDRLTDPSGIYLRADITFQITKGVHKFKLGFCRYRNLLRSGLFYLGK